MPSDAQTRAWLAHPNASGPVATLLAIHDQFRVAARRLVDLVAEGRDPLVLARAFLPLAHTLHHHHHAEEILMFPFVARRTGVEPAQLQVDHDEMTAAIEAAEAALVAREGVAEAVMRFHDILIAHLDREEELVVPVFLALAPGAAWAMLHGG